MIFDEQNFPALPTSWTQLTVENASYGVSIRDKVPAKSYQATGILPVIDQGATLIGGYTNDESLSITGRLPVVVFGDHTRVLKFINFPFAAGADGVKVLAPREFFIPRVFFRFLQAIRLPDKGYARHYQHLRTSQIALPPLPEQKRIADKLDTVLARVDACYERLNRVPLILKRFRESVLAAAISGRLTEDWRRLNEHITPIDLSVISNKKLGEIKNDEKYISPPSLWSWARFGSVVSLINGDRGKNYPNQSEYVKKGIPFINTGHIDPNGSLSIERMNYITPRKFDSLGSGKIRSGDLVYCLRGATMGKTAFVEPFEEGAIASSLVIVRPSEAILSKYAYFFLISPQGKNLILRFDNGTAQPNLSAGSVALYPIAIPPLEEQKQIISRIETLFAFADRLEARLAAARTTAERLTPALLAKAFRGELVPQDPNDEPAAELLKRLAAARESAPKGKRKSKTDAAVEG